MAINNAINANPLPASLGGTGVISPTDNGVVIAKAASPMVSQVLTNGQLIVGSTGAQPVAAAITQQDGINITNGAGSISVTTTPNAKASMPFNFMMMGG